MSASICSAATPEPGLLFYLPGDHGFTADYAAGNPEPNYLANVRIISDGARGKAFECASTQLMAYWAPGNIYAQRAARWPFRGVPGTRWVPRRSRFFASPTRITRDGTWSGCASTTTARIR